VPAPRPPALGGSAPPSSSSPPPARSPAAPQAQASNTPSNAAGRLKDRCMTRGSVPAGAPPLTDAPGSPGRHRSRRCRSAEGLLLAPAEGEQLAPGPRPLVGAAIGHGDRAPIVPEGQAQRL